VVSASFCGSPSAPERLGFGTLHAFTLTVVLSMFRFGSESVCRYDGYVAATSWTAARQLPNCRGCPKSRVGMSGGRHCHGGFERPLNWLISPNRLPHVQSAVDVPSSAASECSLRGREQHYRTSHKLGCPKVPYRYAGHDLVEPIAWHYRMDAR
jgi:hypothetical protein